MKRHMITAGGGILGIVLTILLLMSGASTIQGRQSAAVPDFALETPDMTDVPDLGGDGIGTGDEQTGDGQTGDGQTGGSAPVPADAGENGTIKPDDKSVRDIAPEQFGLPQEVTAQPLERIEPRTPLSDPVARPEPVPVVLRHPVALSAGLLQFGDRLLQLEGLMPQGAERTCGEAGKAWPCGLVARTAFRNFLRARALVCKAPKNGWQGTLTAACTVSDADPALWLAENGWAEVQGGSPLADKVEAAQKSRIGFFGDDPRDFSATPVLLDETAVPGDAETGVDTSEQGL